MRTRLTSLVLLFIVAGGAFAGSPLHLSEQSCSMGGAMGEMDCCKAALMKARTAESASARLCCAVNCSRDGTTLPGGVSLSPQSHPAVSPTHPAGLDAVVHSLSLLRHDVLSHGPPVNSHPTYIRNLSLLI